MASLEDSGRGIDLRFIFDRFKKKLIKKKKIL